MGEKVSLDSLDERVSRLESRDKEWDQIKTDQIVMGKRMDGFENKLDKIDVNTSTIASNIQEGTIQRVKDIASFEKGKAQEIGNTRWAAVLLFVSFLGIMAVAVQCTTDRVEKAATGLTTEMQGIKNKLIELETKEQLQHKDK